jgi:hypothetical protein
VVAEHPYRRDSLLVKRVTEVREDGRCFLKGENQPDSTDSRSFSLLPAERILGRVTSRFG